MADCISDRNSCRLFVDFYVERKQVRLAASGHHLVHHRHHRLLCADWPFRRIRSDGPSVGENLSPFTAKNILDLLTFNLFLQLTDGLVSYQAFALGAVEANPVVAAQS